MKTLKTLFFLIVLAAMLLSACGVNQPETPSSVGMTQTAVATIEAPYRASATPGTCPTSCQTATPGAPTTDFVIDIFGRQTKEKWSAEEYARMVMVFKAEFVKEIGLQADLTTLFGNEADVTMAKALNVKTSFELDNDGLQAFVTSDGKVFFIDRTGYVYGQLSCTKWDGSKLSAFVDDTGPHGVFTSESGACADKEITVKGPYDLDEVLKGLGPDGKYKDYAELAPQLRLAQDLLADRASLDLTKNFAVIRVWLGEDVVFPFGQ